LTKEDRRLLSRLIVHTLRLSLARRSLKEVVSTYELTDYAA
jgi:hypothetical protein